VIFCVGELILTLKISLNIRNNEMLTPYYDHKLQPYSKLSGNQPTGLCFYLFPMIQTCTYLYSS